MLDTKDEKRDPETEPDPPIRASQLKALVTKPVDLQTISITGLFLIALFVTLHLARSLFLPVVLAILLTFSLDPTVRFLRRFRLPRPAAAALVLLSLLSLLGFGFHQTLEPARQWMSEAPETLSKVRKKIERILEPVEEVSKAARQVEELTQIQSTEDPSPVVTSDPSLGESIFAGTQDFLFGAGVVVILSFFLLSSGDLFLEKLVRMLPRIRDKRNVVKIALHVRRDISTHLLTVSSINVLLGVAVGLATYLIGMPNPLLWGVMAALLNFIPYLGAVLGTAILAAAALLTFDSLLLGFAVPAFYLLLTGIEGSLVTPMVLGRRLELNPVVVFLGLFFWGTIWGIAGALLAVPLLITFKIVCDHLEPLEPIGEFLGR